MVIYITPETEPVRRTVAGVGILPFFSRIARIIRPKLGSHLSNAAIHS